MAVVTTAEHQKGSGQRGKNFLIVIIKLSCLEKITAAIQRTVSRYAVISEIRNSKNQRKLDLRPAGTTEHAAKTSIKVDAALLASTSLLARRHHLEQRLNASDQRDRGELSWISTRKLESKITSPTFNSLSEIIGKRSSISAMLPPPPIRAPWGPPVRALRPPRPEVSALRAWRLSLTLRPTCARPSGTAHAAH
jgi:hypothetical protein